jgi:hypothetical protein
MAKGRFGGETYKPKFLGPEPAAPNTAVLAATSTPTPTLAAAGPTPMLPLQPSGVRTRILSDKVPFASRVSPAAQTNLAQLVERTGRPITHLLDEALADLVVKYKKDLS